MRLYYVGSFKMLIKYFFFNIDYFRLAFLPKVAWWILMYLELRAS